MANADPSSGGRGREVSKVLLRMRRRVSYDLAVLGVYIYIFICVYLLASFVSYPYSYQFLDFIIILVVLVVDATTRLFPWRRFSLVIFLQQREIYIYI